MAAHLNNVDMANLKMLPANFNKRKKCVNFVPVQNPALKEIQNLGREQCLGRRQWKIAGELSAWMMSAETAAFMKMGGLGMVASELPLAYNRKYAAKGDDIKVVTPLYVGDTGKKKASFADGEYRGAEGRSVKLLHMAAIEVPFVDHKDRLVNYKVNVYQGRVDDVDYLFLENEHFFTIDLHKDNPSAQDGCYVYNRFGVNEVERFAFFSKAVYILLKDICENNRNRVSKPNLLIANDWHSGEISGLLKYFTTAEEELGLMPQELAKCLKEIPVVHIVHHMGYQGWDYKNTARLLNSIYEYAAHLVYKNAKAVKNSNPRTTNTLVVYDSYNQASCNMHLADHLVTVSKNYMEEVSKFLDFGLDFRDILKIRKDHRTFTGIVNGYEKSLISPNPKKIADINAFFGDTKFEVYDEHNCRLKKRNKAEFIKLISRLAKDAAYKKEKLPLIDFYKFADISREIKNPDDVPVFCATSRMVEQKGYDIAAEAILKLIREYTRENKKCELPIFVMGGAGDVKYFEFLKKLKDEAAKINPEAGRRIFVFRGYKDEFAYAIQLAADFYMMPCRFEPCGLTQMEAMAKGTLPVATSTGGLVDTIADGEDGFRTEVFFVNNVRVYGPNLTARRLKNNVNAYAETLKKVLGVFYNHPEEIERMKVKAMEKDFSWDKGGALEAYYTLFHGENCV